MSIKIVRLESGVSLMTNRYTDKIIALLSGSVAMLSLWANVVIRIHIWMLGKTSNVLIQHFIIV